jgi:hypothetical protein
VGTRAQARLFSLLVRDLVKHCRLTNSHKKSPYTTKLFHIQQIK